MIETAIISALVPAGVDAIKGWFTAWTRQKAGITVDDEIKLGNANVERLKVLAELDKPIGTPSQWVVDLRSSFRYIACGAFVCAGIYGILIPSAISPLAIEAALAASSFIFGERMMLSLKTSK